MTGHEHAGKYQPQVDWGAIAKSSDTIVIYMGIHNLAHILPALQAGGKSSETPIALIQWGTCPNQTELVGTFATILGQIEATGFNTPAIAVVGNVVNLRGLLASRQAAPQP